MSILFEDNHLIAVYKPSGVLTQGDKSKELSLMDLTKSYLKERYKKPGNVFLGLLHRLDKPVSGVVLFAKTSKAASRMSKAFRERKVTKVYWALVEGVPDKKESTLKHFVFRESNRTKVFDKNLPGAKLAELRYRVVREFDKYCLCEVVLLTGRKHQIRAQLAHIGCPVLGDTLYGSSARLGNIALVAIKLEFSHPINNQILTIEVPEQDFSSAFNIV
ncbi:MAG: RNA pseudouridine synthase [Deltaproteobacteria bacterium]|nr:RNA pseudouridine synthase [Deltaproteobacteria bacterium]